MADYAPKLLRIDLSTGTAKAELIPENIVKPYVGGRGFGAKYLYDELQPGIDPLGPENKLLLLSGPLAGTSAQSFSRWMAVTKSPLTGTFCRSVGGSDFGAWLKFAGYDILIIEGKADKPVYVYIDEGRCEVRDASALWGKNIFETQDILTTTHGATSRAVCIGPAGEKLVRFAGIFSGRRTAGRGGCGTVMGSKNLKAVAIKARRQERVARPDDFKKLVKGQIEAYKEGHLYDEFGAAGTLVVLEAVNAMGFYPVRNFREGQIDDFQKLGPAEFIKITEEHVGCYACMINCGKMRRVPDGPYAGIVNEGPEYESVWAFTGSINSTDIGATIAADRLCDELGMDTVSCGNAIGFAYELFEKGIITTSDTDGLRLEYGNGGNPVPNMMKLIEKIARREGFGDVLADGVMRAAARIGKGAEACAMHVKGLELPAYDPRGAKAHGLSFATASRGADHNYGYAIQEIFNVPIPRPVDRLADEGKGDIAKFNQDFTATYELGIACTFPAVLGWLSLEQMGKLLSAATGLPEYADLGFLLAAGERVYNLERLFNIREGFGRKDDTLPKRMLTEPLKKGASEGEMVRKLDTLLDEYYQARGWDSQGIPTPQKLKELGL